MNEQGEVHFRARLVRDSPIEPWAMSLEGGLKPGAPLILSHVNADGPAGRGGLKRGDVVLKLEGKSASQLDLASAEAIIGLCEHSLDVIVERYSDDVPARPLISTNELLLDDLSSTLSTLSNDDVISVVSSSDDVCSVIERNCPNDLNAEAACQDRRVTADCSDFEDFNEPTEHLDGADGAMHEENDLEEYPIEVDAVTADAVWREPDERVTEKSYFDRSAVWRIATRSVSPNVGSRNKFGLVSQPPKHDWTTEDAVSEDDAASLVSIQEDVGAQSTINDQGDRQTPINIWADDESDSGISTTGFEARLAAAAASTTPHAFSPQEQPQQLHLEAGCLRNAFSHEGGEPFSYRNKLGLFERRRENLACLNDTNKQSLQRIRPNQVTCAFKALESPLIMRATSQKLLNQCGATSCHSLSGRQCDSRVTSPTGGSMYNRSGSYNAHQTGSGSGHAFANAEYVLSKNNGVSSRVNYDVGVGDGVRGGCSRPGNVLYSKHMSLPSSPNAFDRRLLNLEGECFVKPDEAYVLRINNPRLRVKRYDSCGQHFYTLFEPVSYSSHQTLTQQTPTQTPEVQYFGIDSSKDGFRRRPSVPMHGFARATNKFPDSVLAMNDRSGATNKFPNRYSTFDLRSKDTRVANIDLHNFSGKFEPSPVVNIYAPELQEHSHNSVAWRQHQQPYQPLQQQLRQSAILNSPEKISNVFEGDSRKVRFSDSIDVPQNPQHKFPALSPFLKSQPNLTTVNQYHRLHSSIPNQYHQPIERRLPLECEPSGQQPIKISNRSDLSRPQPQISPYIENALIERHNFVANEVDDRSGMREMVISSHPSRPHRHSVVSLMPGTTHFCVRLNPCLPPQRRDHSLDVPFSRLRIISPSVATAAPASSSPPPPSYELLMRQRQARRPVQKEVTCQSTTVPKRVPGDGILAVLDTLFAEKMANWKKPANVEDSATFKMVQQLDGEKKYKH